MDEDVAGDVQTVREAMEELEEAKEETRRRASEISQIARTLRLLGEQNHFAPMVRDALKGQFR